MAPRFASFLTYTEVKDYDDLIARYRQLPAAFDQAIHHMRAGMAEGLMPPKLRTIAQELPELPSFRQHGGYTSFSEGWALYSERLGKEVGFYSNPYSDYGRLQDEMLRAIRLVVDTGFHFKGWSRDDVVQFFRDHSAMDEVDIQNETDRYMVWPGQALAYKIGQLKILELRHRAEEALGEDFDVRAFHDEVLGGGALPLDVLET